ncbi:hypothetical protein MJO28_005325 [Puccinia striiformis f. sp. tritici]|uniref:Uncharacterized protein n=1 Tax=Puccinia striiformis f. sp. tritici TaxID=168172 RepID=A0ACC0EKE4_9BASI|nr:hypothetical protein MJO28_005325 [Puccinia striiformis f. sp. tritici]
MLLNVQPFEGLALCSQRHPSPNFEHHHSKPSISSRMNSYSIVPPNHAKPSHISTDIHTNGLATGSAKLAPRHPLQNRLANWQTTQDNFKFTIQRDLYGAAFPLRQMMERDLIKRNTTLLPGQLKPSNFHLDILMGKDELIDESNAFLPNIAVGAEGSSNDKTDFHSQMEKKYKI